ncbi:hypothetical protein TNIN_223661 [Trichonephila inaurata madagascariensis]|uniref:Uncharacterized protein n=1 Tax=Trichonephila inaurata madagascariensis TaxID=2747483 RepID=A0A8X6XSC1_9ARAC|nr:hypothetical protein TNIN_223661 [Trichonephila inaurata madagascariensis]
MQLESPIRKIQEECPTSTVPVTRCSSRSSKSDLELMEIKFKNISFLENEGSVPVSNSSGCWIYSAELEICGDVHAVPICSRA